LLFYFRAPRWRSFWARYPTIELLSPARCGRIVPKKDATKLRLFLIVGVRDVPKAIFICGITCAGCGEMGADVPSMVKNKWPKTGRYPCSESGIWKAPKVL